MPSLRGRHRFSGLLHAGNVEKIHELVSEVLPKGTRYIFTAVNEGFGWVPEVRVETVEAVHLRTASENGYSGVTVVDSYGIAAFSNELLEAPKWKNDVGYTGPDGEKLSIHQDVRVTISDEAVRVELYAPAGHRIYWQFQTIPVDHCDRCGAPMPTTCGSCDTCAHGKEIQTRDDGSRAHHCAACWPVRGFFEWTPEGARARG